MRIFVFRTFSSFTKNNWLGTHLNNSLNLQKVKTMASHSSLHRNRLADEKSPYLLQHAENPVDWYPWGDEAIRKAKDESKLIFLSVGYSTCHWCHVMEKESFMNEEVAKIMNHYFVNIKVDREERPDIDQIYMNFLVKTNGGGGWPMSVWITPDLAPIFAGTYFPPEDHWGRAGFKKILLNIANKWQDNKDQLIKSGKTIVEKLMEPETDDTAREQNSSTIQRNFDQAAQVFERISDDEWGGFSREPKFPEVSKLNFLMHMNSMRKSSFVYEFISNTLKKIAKGGIHDHVFGGFARYSVDRKWHVPHFEKMLYDQGQLMMAYSNAYKATQNKYYLDVADDIVKYIRKDLQHLAGGFYSGEDADSYPAFGDAEKIEGAFYAWTYDEIKKLFKENSSKFSIEKPFEIYCHYYSLTEEGNVEPSSDPQGHLLGKNILIILTTLEETASTFKVSKDAILSVLKQGNSILYEERCKRPRPHLDTKIITSWNGLVLSGLSQLACISDAPNRSVYLETASNLVKFIKKYLYVEKSKTVLRSCYGESTTSDIVTVLDHPINGFLDDYAFLIKGLLDYYVASLDKDILYLAKTLQTTQDRLFWDEKDHGYFYSEAAAPNVIIRMKDAHDGAEPSGNSVAAINLTLLSIYFEDDSFKQRASQLFQCFGHLQPFGYILPEMFSGLLLSDRGVPMLVVVGQNSESSLKLIDVVRSFYIPGLVIIHNQSDTPDSVTRPSAGNFKMIDNLATAYMCHNQVCDPPITNPEILKQKLSVKYLFK